jgi:tRNA threonylcarbamoyladenosine biosynthesis protein TsaB
VRILGFDTATAATTTALLDTATGVAIEARDDPPAGVRPGHAALLMAQVIEVLGRGGITFAEVDRIAVGVGPGTFTGLRIGVATARALGAARRIPLCAISSLEALALGTAVERAERADAVVVAAVDARRGETFVASWGLEPGTLGRQTTLPRAVGPEALAQLVAEQGAPVLAIGSGAIEFRAAFERAGAEVPPDGSALHRMSATHHCTLAQSASTHDHGDVVPEYLRRPDAELALRERSGP